MKLQVFTPLDVVVDATDVTEIQAEDSTGSFGILPHHAAFTTVLTISVISWRTGASTERRVAVRGGLLRVSGDLIEVATPQAIAGKDLESLGPTVLEHLRHEAEAETSARRSETRLHIGLMRQMQRYLGTREDQLPAFGEQRLPAASEGPD
jgi:F-type H+-transporting ATPase subunit epsilon